MTVLFQEYGICLYFIIFMTVLFQGHGGVSGFILSMIVIFQGHGGFSGFTMSMYVIYLLSRRKLNKMMSNYQIMRNTLLQLGMYDI